MKKPTVVVRHAVLGARQLPAVKGGAVVAVPPIGTPRFDPDPSPWHTDPEPTPW
jgi:hypothetical protein